MSIEVKGTPELVRTIGQAVEHLTDFSVPNREAATIAAGAARGMVPVRSGRLKRTIRAGSTRKAATIKAGGSGVLYAGVIDRGWPGRHITAEPFLAAGAQASEGRWIPVYENFVQDQLTHIKGA